MILPKQIAVELTNRCNGRCTMCPNRLSTRKRQDIDPDLYLKILKDVKGLKVLSREQALGLCGVGEPTLHPEFESLIWMTHDLGVPYGIGTNGAKFEQYIDLFLEYPPEEVCFSADGMNQDTYSVLRPNISLEKVMRGAQEYLTALRKADHIPHKIWVQMLVVEENKHEVNDFIRHWLPYTEPVNGRIFLKCICPWPHYPVNTLYPSPVPDVDPELQDKITMAQFDPPLEFRHDCELFNNFIQILSDGSYVPCCSPTRDYWGIGNAADTDITTVFNGRKMEALRAANRADIPYCKDCI